MELLLKIPRGKLPFIGVFGDYSNLARLNEDLIQHHRKEVYKLVLEIQKKGLHLMLICEEKLILKDYFNLKYDIDKLKTWLFLTKNATQFNFSHVYQDKNGKEAVMKCYPGDRLFVLKIEKIEILTLDGQALGIEETLNF